VPVVEEEKVGLLDLDVEDVIAVWTEWTIVPYRRRRQHEWRGRGRNRRRRCRVRMTKKRD
jgi:hypothetical protein